MDGSRRITAVAIGLALTGIRAFASPETLVLRNLNGTKTIEVEINYENYPKVEVPPGWPPGTRWPDFERDTIWYDSSGWTGPITNVEYTHPFRTRFNGVEGSGWDYIDYESPGGNQHYHGMLLFQFEIGDTVHYLLADGPHYRENPKLPVPNQIFAPGSAYQMDYWKYRLPNWDFIGIDTYRMVDRHPNWGNGPANHEAGPDTAAVPKGKAGAPPPWIFLRPRPPG
jgi:hypothetical protein